MAPPISGPPPADPGDDPPLADPSHRGPVARFGLLYVRLTREEAGSWRRGSESSSRLTGQGSGGSGPAFADSARGPRFGPRGPWGVGWEWCFFLSGASCLGFETKRAVQLNWTGTTESGYDARPLLRTRRLRLDSANYF